MNPVLAITKELVESNKAEVVISNNDSFRSKIESAGARYSKNPHLVDLPESKGDNKFEIFRISNYLFDVASNSLDYMIQLTDSEKPDIIIVDQLFFPVRIMMDYLRKRHEASGFSKETKPPLVATVVTSIKLLGKDIEKNNLNMLWYDKLWAMVLFFIFFLRQFMLKVKYGNDIKGIEKLFFPNDEVGMVTVLREFQPRGHMFKNCEFTGACISEDIRKDDNEVEFDGVLKEIMDKHKPVNPLKLIDSFLPDDYKPNDRKLIYVSLGTVFNQNQELIKKIFRSIDLLNNDENQKFDVVISLGQSMFTMFSEKVKSGNL
jgi:UDP:flavonoid glycosyltransferase YjiC (YdhE family)